jgi:peptidoglycan/xylan/chitin deacetylase (PgdA/CDA1 family)/protein-L-isoaspartate O-methyltransferase
MPGAATLFPRSDRAHAEMVLWPRHPGAPCGTSASRRASLPQSVLPELKRWAAAGREALISCLNLKGSGRTIRYAPELVWRSPGAQSHGPEARATATPPALPATDPAVRSVGSAVLDQHHPHHRTLQLLPARRFRTALEIVCADGHLTAQLAPRVERLLATDTSSAALELTRQRCESHANVEVHELDPVYDPLPRDRFDLIVYRDLPDYAGSRAAMEVVAEKLTTALEPGGYFVCVHTPKPAPAIEGTGSDDALPEADLANSIFRQAQGLHLLHEVHGPSCRIQLYQRSSLWSRWLSRPVARVQWSADATPPSRAPAGSTTRAGRVTASPSLPAATTHRLPILMYHRVATDGPAELARYRVSPQEFEAQLRFLKEHGYTSTSLEEWRTVRDMKRPLPGKRVLLTFDDGCADFIETAWPLLERYGFKAVMFLPTDVIGDACRWDAHLGEPARVMSWADLRALQKAGVEFGSHTATHPLLTGLSPDEMAREALRSRAAIAEELGLSVTSIAYPYGAFDRVVESAFGAAGYLYGFTCEHRCCEVSDRLLALPRVEVSGGLTLAEFEKLLVL